MEWGEVIRSCYGRKAGLELEQLELGKEERKARRKAERQAAKRTTQISATEEESGHDSAMSMTDEDREEDEAEQSRTPNPTSGPLGVTPLTKKINSLILVSPPKRGRTTGGSEASLNTLGGEEGEGESPSKKAALRSETFGLCESESIDLIGHDQALSSRSILRQYGAKSGRRRRPPARRKSGRGSRPLRGQSGNESEMEWQRLDREMMACS